MKNNDIVPKKHTQKKFRKRTNKLLSELRIYQIELEMQNEELRATQNQLAEEREKYSDLYHFAPIAYFTIDEQSIIEEVNLTGARLLGVERKYLNNQPITPYLTPASLEKFLKACAQTSESKVAHDCELIIRPQTTEQVYVQARVTALSVRNHQPPRWRLVMTDISDRKRAEDKLRIFSRVIEQSQVSVMITDPDGLIEYINPKFSEITGYASGEVIGKNPRFLKATAKTKQEYENLWEMIKSGNEWHGEFHNRKKSGEEFWESTIISPVINETGLITHLVAIKEDITGRKTMQDTLRESEARYRRLVEGLPAIVYTFSNQRGDLFYSPCIEQILGYSREELLTNPFLWKNAIHPDDMPKVDSAINNLVAGQSFDIEYRAQTKSGEWRWLMDRSIGIKVENDEILIEGLATDITERKNIEIALQESEERFRSLVNSLSDVIYTLDTEQRHTAVFGDWVEKSGLTPDFFLGKRPREIVGAASAAIHEAANERALAGQSNIYEWSTNTEQGTLYYQTLVSPMRDANGKITGLVCAGRDVTELKRTEHALQEKTQELERFFSTNLDLLCIADTDGFFHRLNREWENTLGYSLSELEGRSFLDLVHPDDLDATLGAIAYLSSQEPQLNFENRYRCKDGSYRWIEWRSSPHGKIIYAAARDITDRKRIEETLRESNARQKALFENVRDAILIADPETGLILDANAQAEKLFGFSRQAIIGKHQIDLHPSRQKEQPSSNLKEHARGGKKLFEDEIVAADGRTIPVEVNASLVSVPNGKPVLQGIFRDITEQKRNQAMLQTRMEILELATRQSPEDFLQNALDKVVALTNSKIGFYHFVDPDQKTLSLQTWSTRTLQEFCKVEGKGLHYKIDKAGVWVDCIRQGKPVIHNDYESLAEKKGLPPGHAKVIRELVVPIYRYGKVVAILGVGNKPNDYLESDTIVVSYLADVIWEIVQRERVIHSLSEVESRLHLLSQNISDTGLYVYTHEAQGQPHFEYFSPGMEALTGVKTEDALQNASSIHNAILPEYLQALVNLESQSKQSLEPFELEFRQRNAVSGEIRWMLLRSTPRRRTDGSTVWYGVQIDITERKSNEQVLKDVNQRLRTQMSEIEKLQDELREQALRDSLTNLYNRHYMTESLQMEINRAKRKKQPFSVVILDLDNLKAINDRHGHISGGDHALQTLANALKKMCRDSDTICRYGGDEFLVIMYDTPASIALRRANEWLKEVQKIKLESESGEFNISFSGGLAEYLIGEDDGESILIRADRALYHAKGNGKKRVECYLGDMNSA